jgi:hypothetical protein
MVEIRQVDYRGSHRYQVIGDPAIDEEKLLPSCSTIAKYADSGGGDGLIHWALDAYEETNQKNAFAYYREVAADTGNKLHAEIHEFIAKKIADKKHEPKTQSPLFWSWYSSMHERGVQWIGAEVMVYNRELQYGGTIDAIALVDGKYTLFDWKTTTQLSKNGKKKYYSRADHAVQVAGYLMALHNEEVNFVQSAYVVYIYRDTNEVEWRKVDIASATTAFRACNTLYDIKGGLYERRRKSKV